MLGGGEQQMVAMARPKLLIRDEPSLQKAFFWA
jgi:ABC-type branched-subunit amino acid transport system ATPase component